MAPHWVELVYLGCLFLLALHPISVSDSTSTNLPSEPRSVCQLMSTGYTLSVSYWWYYSFSFIIVCKISTTFFAQGSWNQSSHRGKNSLCTLMQTLFYIWLACHDQMERCFLQQSTFLKVGRMAVGRLCFASCFWVKKWGPRKYFFLVFGKESERFKLKTGRIVVPTFVYLDCL